MPEVQRGDGSASLLLQRESNGAVGHPVLVPGMLGRIRPENSLHPEILPPLQELHAPLFLPLYRDSPFFSHARNKLRRSTRLNATQHPLSVLPFAWYSLSDCTNPLTTIPLLRSVRYRGQVESREGHLLDV